MTNLIAIKGSRTGLRLQLDESAEWPELLDALRIQLDQGSHFFNGARITIDVGERSLADEQLESLLAVMRQHHLEPESLASTSRESRNAARAIGVQARPIARSAAPRDEPGDAIFVQRTVRSGQVVRHQGSITILGDVNAGSEIVAGGSVLVWGRVRGTIHAGALGDRTASISALDLAPTQLRIADLITRPPDSRAGRGPENARIEGEQIIVTAWDARRQAG
jgi:septum site-determining protein MinC